MTMRGHFNLVEKRQEKIINEGGSKENKTKVKTNL